MAVSLVRTDFSSWYVAAFAPSFVPALSIRPNLRDIVVGFPRLKRIQCSFRLPTGEGKPGSIIAEGSCSVISPQGHWEDPDDGSGSEIDDDSEEEKVEDMDENDLDFESDWDEENDAATRVKIVNNLSPNNYEEDFAKEVEQLLSSEERAILEANDSPCLERISTRKWLPLHTFALAGQIKDMDRLLEKGVDINLTDQDGRTALHHATIGKKEPVISHLLRKGANVNVRDQDGATALHYAVQVGAMQTVKLLIKYNVDVNTADDEGWTPLHVAVQSRNRDITKILLVNGADKTRKNKVRYHNHFCFGPFFSVIILFA
ncbi:OLC1v1000714C2 [Oldenlandia corymbosa var. corymbosa]|uniref:OLC1v1000714C2 n=1 Tax=Oldenlandia corymbosa var. corymbosa TaxID=529605 RepID=A0AAV1D3X2_OLDCO|nr:OLC1v1000714C2 [Oldenlandia corymbosa var. corymbosa]